jgi:hypothetical protein
MPIGFPLAPISGTPTYEPIPYSRVTANSRVTGCRLASAITVGKVPARTWMQNEPASGMAWSSVRFIAAQSPLTVRIR